METFFSLVKTYFEKLWRVLVAPDELLISYREWHLPESRWKLNIFKRSQIHGKNLTRSKSRSVKAIITSVNCFLIWHYSPTLNFTFLFSTPNLQLASRIFQFISSDECNWSGRRNLLAEKWSSMWERERKENKQTRRSMINQLIYPVTSEIWAKHLTSGYQPPSLNFHQLAALQL